jgi:hypothetical protein
MLKRTRSERRVDALAELAERNRRAVLLRTIAALDRAGEGRAAEMLRKVLNKEWLGSYTMPEGDNMIIESALQRVREMHHKIARMMASGEPDAEIAAVVGRPEQRIRDYRLDPMMKDLIAHYKSQQA